jgi:hypothetical protein
VRGGVGFVLSFGAGSAGAAEVPNDFVYQLQRINLEAIGKTKFDLVIMDYSRAGSDTRKSTAGEIELVRISACQLFAVRPLLACASRDGFRAEGLSSAAEIRTAPPC